MPVDVEYKLREGGWKKEENTRFGACAVAKFLNTKDGSRMFEWAPTITDCHNMIAFCKQVLELDTKNKEIFALGKRMEKLGKKTTGCEPCANVTGAENQPM